MYITNDGCFPSEYLFEDQCCLHVGNVKVELANADLWKEFSNHGTEMILTKGGRRMFPSLELQVSRLDPEASYCVLLEITPLNNCRYKFNAGAGWTATGTEEVQQGRGLYLHPQSPAKGAQWMAQKTLFDKIKLTNTASSKSPDHLVLSSMHRYVPTVHVVRTDDVRAVTWAPRHVISFQETEFIAVTAYQNEKITQLKIDNNPFAKGFRETGQAKCKRKRRSDESSEKDSRDSSKSSMPKTDENPSEESSSSRSSSVGSAERDLPSPRVHTPQPVTLLPYVPSVYHPAPFYYTPPALYPPPAYYTPQPYHQPFYHYLPYGAPPVGQQTSPTPAVVPSQVPPDNDDSEIDVLGDGALEVGQPAAVAKSGNTDFSMAAILSRP